MTPTLSNSSQYGGSLLESNNNANNSLISTLAQMRPQTYEPDINSLNKLANQQAILNSEQSKAAEAETNPNLAATRALQQSDIQNTYNNAVSGDIPVALKNQFLKAGLTEGLQNTGNVAPGTAGLSNLGNIFGQNYLNYQNQIRSMANQYLGENPLQSAGIDPSSALNLTVGGKQNTTNTNNAFQQQLGQAMVNARGNQTNLANSLFSGAVNEGNSNAAQSNALKGAWIGFLGQAAGAAAKGAMAA